MDKCPPFDLINHHKYHPATIFTYTITNSPATISSGSAVLTLGLYTHLRERPWLTGVAEVKPVSVEGTGSTRSAVPSELRRERGEFSEGDEFSE